MRYYLIVGLAAATLSLALPSQAVSQSLTHQAPHQATHSPTYIFAPLAFKLDADAKSVATKSALKLQSASFATSEDAAQVLPDQSMRIAPEQRTKSAAYKWEAAFLALSAIDAVETISCSNRATCTENNPIWGHHPSTGKVVAAKLGLGLIHFGVFKLIADRDPHTALRAAQVSAAVQGSVVLLNLRTVF